MGKYCSHCTLPAAAKVRYYNTVAARLLFIYSAYKPQPMAHSYAECWHTDCLHADADNPFFYCFKDQPGESDKV
jgi:hypothetical protein